MERQSSIPHQGKTRLCQVHTGTERKRLRSSRQGDHLYFAPKNEHGSISMFRSICFRSILSVLCELVPQKHTARQSSWSEGGVWICVMNESSSGVSFDCDRVSGSLVGLAPLHNSRVGLFFLSPVANLFSGPYYLCSEEKFGNNTSRQALIMTRF